MSHRSRKRNFHALFWRWLKRASAATRVLGPYLLSLGFAGIVFGGSFAFAVQSHLFELARVRVDGAGPLSENEAFGFAGLEPGQRLFEIDLRKAEHWIRSHHPEFKDVRVRRLHPDEIAIELEKRDPIAQLQGDRFYLIDSDLMVLAARDGASDVLPLIKGLRGVSRLAKGAVIRHELLRESLRLVLEIRRQKVLGAHEITEVDVGDKRNLSLWIDGAVEIRINPRDLGSGYHKLLDALRNLDIDRDRIQYIDLRFDDIVIGPR